MLRNLKGDYYTIPFRTLVPKDIKNIMFAGSDLSVDIKAFASVRGMPQCMIMGQSIGTAACMAIDKDCSVQDIDRKRLIEKLLDMGVRGIGGEKLEKRGI